MWWIPHLTKHNDISSPLFPKSGGEITEPVLVVVTLGEHNTKSISPQKTEQKYTISPANIDVHPLYNHTTKDNDIAKLYLDQPIDFAQHPKIHPICLPANANEDYTGRNATATGWGLVKWKTPAEVLQEINIGVISLDECNKRLRQRHKSNAFKHLATEKEICTIGDVSTEGQVPRICRGRFFHISQRLLECMNAILLQGTAVAP